MKLAIVHLSDAHFRADGSNPILRRQDTEATVVAGITGVLLAHDVDDVFIVFSGDIAAIGREAEFRVAEAFLKEVARGLAEFTTEKCPAKIVVVPGNHDCCFDGHDVKGVRETLLSKSGEELSEAALHACLDVQQNFRSFADKVSDASACTTVLARACTEVRDYQSTCGTVRFLLLNTAWCSRKKEVQGNLTFPLQELPTPEQLPSTEIAISVQHHPANWLNHSASRTFTSKLERLVDVALTGHEHASGDRLVSRPSGGAVGYFEGLALQDEHSGDSELKVVILDSDDRRATAHTLRYSRSHYMEREEGPERLPFLRNVARVRGYVQMTDRFQLWLSDPELPF